MDDASARLDEAAQDRLLADDTPVIPAVGCCRDHRDERVKVGCAADTGDIAVLGKLGRDSDCVGRLALAVQIQNGAVDGLMGGAVKVTLTHHLDNVGDRIFAQKHRSDDRLLSRNIVRGRPILAA